jgi:hypothetical protein
MLIAAAGYLTWLTIVSLAVEQKVGQGATRQQQDVALRQMLASGELPPVPREAVILFVGGSLAGGLALIFGIRSLLRQEPRRGLAIAALVISASIIFCLALPMLVALATRSATRSP